MPAVLLVDDHKNEIYLNLSDNSIFGKVHGINNYHRTQIIQLFVKLLKTKILKNILQFLMNIKLCCLNNYFLIDIITLVGIVFNI